jgi:hypothetical protein
MLQNSVKFYSPTITGVLDFVHRSELKKLEKFSETASVSRTMLSSGMLRRVGLVRADDSEELSASIIRVTRIVRRLLVTVKVVPSSPIIATLIMEALRSSESTVLTSSTRRNILEDDILHGLRCDNHKSYICFLTQEKKG